MVALFAVGVITGTILSFEMGLLWPNFMATFGAVFGLGFAIEGFSFFMEAIFIGIYVYGWERLSPRRHLPSGIPIAIAGFTGSLMVISVNAWMQHPGGFRAPRRQGRRRSPVEGAVWEQLSVARADPHVRRRLHRHGLRPRGRLRVRPAARPLGALRADSAGDPADDRRAGRADPGPGRRLGGAGCRHSQPIKLAAMEGLVQDDARRVRSTCSGGTRATRSSTGSRSRICCRCSPSTAGTRPSRGSTPFPPTAAAGQRRPCRVPDDGRDRHAAGAARRSCSSCVRIRRRRLPELDLVLPRRRRWPARPSVVALIAGWVTTEVGRQPWVVYRVMLTDQAVTGASGIPIGYGTLVVAYIARGRGVVWVLRRLAQRPLDAPAGAAEP